MLKTIIQRFFQMIIVMIIVSMLVFVMTYLISNPVYLLLPENATEAQAVHLLSAIDEADHSPILITSTPL